MSRLPCSVVAALVPALLVSITPAGSAAAARRHSAKPRPAPRVTTLALRRSPRLWATINVCDGGRRPARVGLRASIPGTRRRGSLTMEFRVQYYRRDARRWRDARPPARVALGSARVAWRETGLTWSLPAAAGQRLTYRGLVTFEWREGRRTLLRLRRGTTAGRRPSAGSDPKGYSAARCVIRGAAPARARRRGAGRS